MDLFDQIIDFENLHAAYRDARVCKRYRSSILKFGCNLEENLMRIRWELTTKRYRHGDYRTFVVTDSKKRTIKAAPFRDRVVHHAVCNVIEPILERGFIFDSYACRKGKGTHAAVKRLEYFMKSLSARAGGKAELRPRNEAAAQHAGPQVYCLKCDISKYFDSINGEVLFNILQRKIRDENTLWLLREVIQSNPRGIPIGNLTSQLFANVYLNEFDHFVKRELKERYYLRYMDDFIILGADKRHLREAKEHVRIFLRDQLKLSLHPKKAEIAPVGKGIDFLGYVLRDGSRRLRRSTVKRFLKRKRHYEAMVRRGVMAERSYRCVMDSWRGYAGFADSYGLMKKIGLE